MTSQIRINAAADDGDCVATVRGPCDRVLRHNSSHVNIVQHIAVAG